MAEMCELCGIAKPAAFMKNGICSACSGIIDIPAKPGKSKLQEECLNYHLNEMLTGKKPEYLFKENKPKRQLAEWKDKEWADEPEW